eukprot:CAMPEP_0180566782 /NCGR_PEP_ID=MMETSP1037_2-20121125/6260_1 /TAXON_ID=632150 /ORGANISM="Azadinium spinosum, Strain 3D9" /LENGTH=74 /DNA_ID=CAMNT_0022583837 /DNA_START=164 /DNA_END=384 /DNA_ORIENTATION=+
MVSVSPAARAMLGVRPPLQPARTGSGDVATAVPGALRERCRRNPAGLAQASNLPTAALAATSAAVSRCHNALWP